MSELKKRVMKDFSERLKEARIAAGYTSAEDFARVLDVRGPAYRYWERGGSAPPLEMFVRICRMLSVDPNHLLPSAVPREIAKRYRDVMETRPEVRK